MSQDQKAREKHRMGEADPEDLNSIALSFTNDLRVLSALEVLKRLKGCQDDVRTAIISRIDSKNLVERLMEQQIADALLYAVQPHEGDAPLPSSKAIMDSIRSTLTIEQSREILQFHEAILLLTPVTSVERYRQELNQASQSMEGSEQPCIGILARSQLNVQAAQAQVQGNSIKSWRFAITEGAQTFTIPEWDNGQETLQRRIELFNERFAKSKLTRLDHQSYVALMVQSLRQRKPMDAKYVNDSTASNAETEKWQFTLLNKTDEKLGFIGVAYWIVRNRMVNLFFGLLDNQDVRARFRASVMGEIS